MRWMLERQELKTTKYQKSKTVRFCGGGALGETTCQIWPIFSSVMWWW